jgi:cysteinyl-tRNA synthetase
MGRKYLGDTFDIHGGGMDLLFPHHESEIAQANAAMGHDPVRYWMHNNMITVNGQKMGKSLNNFITLDEFFSGTHEALDRAYSPMVIRFFILQAHYRSTVDFSNEALQAAEKGMKRLMDAYHLIDDLKPAGESTVDVRQYEQKCYDAMNDDLNTPIVIAHLFEVAKIINQVNDGKEKLKAEDIAFLKSLFKTFLFDLLGMLDERNSDENSRAFEYLIDTILKIRQEAKEKKDYATADKIRDELTKLGIVIKDTKEGAKWSFK